MLSAFRNFALTFLIAALIFGSIAYFVVGFVLETVEATIEPNDDPVETKPLDLTYADTTDPSTDTSQTTDPPPEEDEINGNTFNILLVGTDYQPELFKDYDYEENWTGDGFPDKHSRSWGADMLILLRIDKENRKFIFCAIPRNTRVQVDGIYTQLGDVLSEKGIDFLCGKVTGLTGLQINYYAVLDVGSITACIDAVGGVSYYVPEDMKYSDPDQNLEIDLKKGTQTINGEKAMQLLRYVGYQGGAYSRMKTAVDFLQKMFAKFTNVTYFSKAPDLYKTLTRYVKTNFSADDLLNNLDLIFAYTKFESITLTYPGSDKTYDDVSYFDPSVSAAMTMFEKYK